MFESLIDLSLGSVARLLSFFYSLPVVGGSFGLAIMLLTLTVMIVLMPLTLKATKSTIKMTQMQPKMRELQKKYKDDKQAMNAEMMALYQQEGVNPVGGCLPMLAQLPVFLVLFNVLRGLARRVGDRPFFAVTDEARKIAGRTSSLDPEAFDPQYLNSESLMYQDLTDGRTSIDFGPFDLGASASDIFQTDILASIPYLILILFVVGSSYYQQRQISARRTDSNDQMTQQQKTQQQLLKILPIMSGVWSFVFPTGLVLYWATSNMFRIGQQSYITRSLYEGDGAGAQMIREQAASREAEAEEAKSGKAKSGKDEDDDAAEAEDRGAERAGSGAGSKDRSSNGRGSSKSKVEAGSTAKGGGPNGSDPSDGDGLTDREKRWAERRAQKAKIQARRAASADPASGGTTTSSRVTPKGTKPTSPRKNKRKR